MKLPGLLRAGAFVGRNGRSLAAVLAVVGVLALAGVGWWAAHPPTTTVTDRTDRVTVQSQLGTRAVVTGNSTLYERGRRLSNQPVYLRATTPNLTLRLHTVVDPPARSMTVEQDLELVIRAKRGGSTFWNRTRPLAGDGATVTDGNLTTAARLSVPRLLASLEPIRQELGDVATLSVYVRVTVRYESDRYSGTLTRLVPLRIGEDSYSLSPARLSRGESTQQSRTRTVPRDTTPALLLLFGGLASLAGAAVTLVGHRRIDVPAVEGALHRERFAEWISSGSLGPGVGERYVHVDSLADLVDVGIDASKRVIHDRELDTYAVIDGEVVYHYGHGSLWQPADRVATRDGGSTGSDAAGAADRDPGDVAPAAADVREGAEPADRADAGDGADRFEWGGNGDESVGERDGGGRTERDGGGECGATGAAGEGNDGADDPFEWFGG